MKKLVLLALFHFFTFPIFSQVTWFAERITLDTVQVGRNPSFLIDSLGYIHLSFWENATDRLIYGKKHISDPTWTFEKVDSAKTGGYVSKIKLDPTGRPAIAYFENVNEQLQVRLATKQFPSGQWSIDTSLQINWGMYGTNAMNAPGYLHASIDFDYYTDNKPYIIFFDARYSTDPEYYGLEMFYAYPDNGSMSYQSYGNIPMFDINITYREWKAGAKYGEFCNIVKQKNGNWSIFTQGTGNGELYRFTTISNPTITNRTVIDSFLRVNPTLSGASTIQEHRLFCTFEGISATEAENEDIHISYGYSNLYGRNNFASWFTPAHLTMQHVRIKANGDIIYNNIFPRDSVYRNFTSIQTVGSDSIFITFNEPNKNRLRMVYSTDTGATWTVKEIQTMFYPDAYAPIFIFQDSIYVMYFHTDNERLELATLPLNNLNANWNIVPVTQSQKTGTTMASLVHKNGNDYEVHIVYNNQPKKQIWYATKKLGQWNFQLIENGRNCTSADIQLDNNQSPVILYNDKDNNVTRLVRKSGSNFIFETVNPSVAGDYLNLKFSPTKDTLHACYYNLSLNTLVYQRKIGNGIWASEFPETVGIEIAGEFPSLTIDGYGLPHIIYYDRQNTQLKHAFKTTLNPNWQKEVVIYDDDIDQGSFCKSVIGPNNVLQACWVNKSANQIEYAKKVLGAWIRDTVISGTVGLVGMPLAMTTDDSSSAWICYNVQNALPEVRIAKKGFNEPEWGSIPVGKNNFQLGNVFDFELMDTLVFIAGRTNKDNELGTGLLTGILSFTAVSNDTEMSLAISIYPNPFQSSLFIETQGANFSNFTVQIWDLQGRKLVEKPLESKTILHLSEIPSGMYVLRIGNYVHKIIKQ